MSLNMCFLHNFFWLTEEAGKKPITTMLFYTQTRLETRYSLKCCNHSKWKGFRSDVTQLEQKLLAALSYFWLVLQSFTLHRHPHTSDMRGHSCTPAAIWAIMGVSALKATVILSHC